MAMKGPLKEGFEPLADYTNVDQAVYFQSEQHTAFYPGTPQTLTIENALLALFMVKLMKTPEGMKLLGTIALKYLDSCARIVESVEDACHSNWLTALNNQHIAAAIAHKIGLMDDGSYIKIMEHYRAVFDKSLQYQYIKDTVGSLTTLVQGSKISTGPEGTGGSMQGLGTLANLLSLAK